MVNAWSKYPIIGYRTVFFAITDLNLGLVNLQITPMTSIVQYYDLDIYITEYPGGKVNGFCAILIAN